MNAELQQILSGCENLASYILRSGDRASAILVRGQARVILAQSEDYAHAVADLGTLGIPIERKPKAKRAQEQHDLDSQFALSFV